MLPIYGIGAFALVGLILIARQHFKAYKAIKSSKNEQAESPNLALLQILHRRNGWAQIALGALFVGVAGCATYVQWPLITSVFMGASMVMQGLMVALPALLVIAVVYFGVQDFKDHGRIHDAINQIGSAHSAAETFSATLGAAEDAGCGLARFPWGSKPRGLPPRGPALLETRFRHQCICQFLRAVGR